MPRYGLCHVFCCSISAGCVLCGLMMWLSFKFLFYIAFSRSSGCVIFSVCRRYDFLFFFSLYCIRIWLRINAIYLLRVTFSVCVGRHYMHCFKFAHFTSSSGYFFLLFSVRSYVKIISLNGNAVPYTHDSIMSKCARRECERRKGEGREGMGGEGRLTIMLFSRRY